MTEGHVSSPISEDLSQDIRTAMTAMLPRGVHLGMASSLSPVRTLSPEEAASLPPAARTARVEEFQLGRAAAFDALRGAALEATPVPRSPNGVPVWPDGVIGSISHSHGIALAAVTRARRPAMLGIDIERVSDDAAALFNSDVLTHSERIWSGSSATRALQIFSAKEAIFKAAYPTCQRLIEYGEVELTATPHGFRCRVPGKDLGFCSTVQALNVRSLALPEWVLSCAFKCLPE